MPLRASKAPGRETATVKPRSPGLRHGRKVPLQRMVKLPDPSREVRGNKVADSWVASVATHESGLNK